MRPKSETHLKWIVALNVSQLIILSAILGVLLRPYV